MRRTECRLSVVCFVGIHSNRIGLFAHLYADHCPFDAGLSVTLAQFQSTVSLISDVTETAGERTIAFGS